MSKSYYLGVELDREYETDGGRKKSLIGLTCENNYKDSWNDKKNTPIYRVTSAKQNGEWIVDQNSIGMDLILYWGFLNRTNI